MKSLKRKALSNASALPAILLMCAMSPGTFTHQYISHGAIATFAETRGKKKKTNKKNELDFHCYEKKTSQVCHFSFQTRVIIVVLDLKE